MECNSCMHLTSQVLGFGICPCTSFQGYWVMASMHAPHAAGRINEGMNQESEGPHRLTIALVEPLRYTVLNLCKAKCHADKRLICRICSIRIRGFMGISAQSQRTLKVTIKAATGCTAHLRLMQCCNCSLQDNLQQARHLQSQHCRFETISTPALRLLHVV